MTLHWRASPTSTHERSIDSSSIMVSRFQSPSFSFCAVFGVFDYVSQANEGFKLPRHVAGQETVR